MFTSVTHLDIAILQMETGSRLPPVYDESIQYGDAVVAQFRGVYPGTDSKFLQAEDYLPVFKHLY